MSSLEGVAQRWGQLNESLLSEGVSSGALLSEGVNSVKGPHRDQLSEGASSVRSLY